MSKRKCSYCSNRFDKEQMIVRGLQAWCSEKHRKESMNKKPKAKVKAKKKKLKSIARLVDDAAVLLQKLVRMKAADSSGYVRSFTSDAVLPWQEMQGSHFIQRNKLATKLTEENVHPQTPGENCFEMKTATGVLKYRRAMVEMYGEEFVQELEGQAEALKKYTRSEVEEIAKGFREQIKYQEERLGL